MTVTKEYRRVSINKCTQLYKKKIIKKTDEARLAILMSTYTQKKTLEK